MKRLGVLLLIPMLLLTACGQSERLEWPDEGICAVLPVPNAKYGTIGLQLEDTFSADLTRCTLDDYTAYVADCMEAGFTIDSEDQGDDYRAYNSDGYELWVYYSDYSEEISIHLDAPKFAPDETYVWPTIGLATMIPQPESSIGSISIDSSSHFYAYIGETTLEDYSAYVDRCIEYGFDVDHSRGDRVFTADNENGDSLRAEYEGFQTMSISIYAADEENEGAAATPDVAPETEALPSPSADSSEGESGLDEAKISPELKEAMDSYEAFIDEYIAFMNEYANSNDTSSMLIDYLAYLEKFSETMEKLDAIDESELTAAEALYYSEVMSRISQKLLSVQ